MGKNFGAHPAQWQHCAIHGESLMSSHLASLVNDVESKAVSCTNTKLKTNLCEHSCDSIPRV